MNTADALTIQAQQYAKVGAARPALRRRIGRGVKREPGAMNKTEAAYSRHLEARKQAGEIAWYAFESWKLKLADKTWLTVDFAVMLANGELEAHEVKGGKKKANGERGYWCEEDAKVKAKVAPEMHPLRFYIVFPVPGGGWGREEL